MRSISLTTRPVTERSVFPATVMDGPALKEIISKDATSGMTLDDMRLGIRLLDAIDGAIDGTLKLSEDEWEFLCRRIKTFRWAIVDQRFLDLADSVLNAPKE